MIISISGTPGTGKTSVAAGLAKSLNMKLLNAADIKTKRTWDKKRKVWIIDVDELHKAALHLGNNIIIEGNLAHFLKADLTVILRCRPDILEKRLSKKKFSKSKIKENVAAEILDVILIEAIQKHQQRKKPSIIEIDTSKMKVDRTVDIIKRLLNNYLQQNSYKPGKIDWTKKYYKKLL